MKIKNEFENQISDSLILAFLLSLTGGFQDAYSYFCRDKVFANAQTGNIVLMGGHIVSGEFWEAVHYLFPVLAFITGIYITEWIRHFYKESHKIHWRQIILFMQIILMTVVGFMPESLNVFANVLLSFSCAVQITTFKKFRGVPFATTMCIGNMRSATEFLAKYHIEKDETARYKSTYYYGAIFVFAAGAAIGSVAARFFYLKSIWIAAVFLFLGFILMMIKENDEKKIIEEDFKNFEKDIKKIKKNIISDFWEEINHLKNIFK